MGPDLIGIFTQFVYRRFWNKNNNEFLTPFNMHLTRLIFFLFIIMYV